MNRVVLVVVIGTLTAALVGCGGDERSGDSAVKHRTTEIRGGVRSARGEVAIAAVLASPAGIGADVFPHHVGDVRCVIDGGGESLGLRIKGRCRTTVTSRPGYSGQTTVVLSETWPWRAFHSAGSRRRPQHHSWRFLVLPSRKVIPQGQRGDLPPQHLG
jgi:hypothetical protein